MSLDTGGLICYYVDTRTSSPTFKPRFARQVESVVFSFFYTNYSKLPAIWQAIHFSTAFDIRCPSRRATRPWRGRMANTRRRHQITGSGVYGLHTVSCRRAQRSRSGPPPRPLTGPASDNPPYVYCRSLAEAVYIRRDYRMPLLRAGWTGAGRVGRGAERSGPHTEGRR